MAKLFGLDIPDGLEQLFAAVLQLKPNGDVAGVGLTLPKTTYKKNLGLRDRSLFLLLQSTWDGFAGGRRDAWQSYWATLPFGAHSGSRGWPGSGYSAFVYVNAPQVRNGDDLILDPPASLGPELVTSPAFEDAGDWSTEDFVNYTDGHFQIYAVSDEYFGALRQTFSTGLENGMYHVEVECSIPAGVVGNYTPIWGGDGSDLGGAGISTSGSGLYAGVTIKDWAGDHQVFSADVNYSNDPTTNGFNVTIVGTVDFGPIDIWRVSLKKYI